LKGLSLPCLPAGRIRWRRPERLEQIPGRIHHTIVEQSLLPQPQLLRGGSRSFEGLTTLHFPRFVGPLLFPRQRLRLLLLSFSDLLVELEQHARPLNDSSP